MLPAEQGSGRTLEVNQNMELTSMEADHDNIDCSRSDVRAARLRAWAQELGARVETMQG